MSIKRDVELIHELGSLDKVRRAWIKEVGVEVSTLSEHHFRVSWIAMIIAQKERADISRVLQMAMIHDIAESRCGDVSYLGRQYVKRDEDKAMKDIFDETALSEYVKPLWDEYEKRESLESKIVKDADNLDVDVDIRRLEFEGHELAKAWKVNRIKEVGNRFFTKSAKEIQDEIYSSEPFNWHFLSPHNRFNGGDWKIK